MVMTPKRYQDADQIGMKGSDPFHSLLQRSSEFCPSNPAWLHPAAESRLLASESFEAIVDELTDSWERGQMTHVEAFLDRMESHDPTHIVELIYHEYCLAELKGLAPDPTEYLRRFPDSREGLNRLFQLHDQISTADLEEAFRSKSASFPHVGDEIGPYHLKRELGSGSAAHVYLAEEGDLDHRLVVLKITTKQTPEPHLLARARHAHIVEVLRHHSAQDGLFHLISMPFLGGATLATVLTSLGRAGRRRPRTGSDLLAALDAVSAPEYPKANLARAAREILAGLSFPAAIAWLMARLAEALDHASLRGVAHGDIKPSNILLTADGNPMLLDFHLAVGWQGPDDSELQLERGGTFPYMAPERLRALAQKRGTLTPNATDRLRADIFSLGIVLLEALTGEAPVMRRDVARSREELAAMIADAETNNNHALHRLARSSVPRGLRSILERCLAPDPAQRYGRASELADDLDRWRTGRPLAFAEEPPWRFRLARWARRQRLALGAVVLVLAVCTLAVALLWASFQTTLRRQAEEKLALVWDREESGVFPFHRFGHWTPDDQGDPAELARRHLKQYDVVENTDWRQRDDIQSLPEPERTELEIWLLEQILRYVRALGDRPGSTADWVRALALLDRTIAHASYRPLLTERQRLQEQLSHQANPPHQALAAPPQSATTPPLWIEEYLRGVLMEPRHARQAQVHFETMLKERPHSLWGHYHAATIAYRLGDQQAAVTHLQECVAQRPRNVNLRAQLAACLFLMGHYEAALAECTRALAIDPDHAISTRNQSFVRGRLGQEAGVESDIRRFELLTRSQNEVLALKIRLEAMLSQDQTSVPATATARVATPERLDLDGRVLRASQLRDRKRHDEALTELDEIIRLEPEHLEACFYRAMLLRKLGRPEAKAEFPNLLAHPRIDELVAQYHDAINIYHQRASDLLHDHEPEQAIEVAQAGLIQANRFKSKRGESHYALARAYAAAARTNPEHVPDVLAELKKAFAFKPALLTKSFEVDRYFDDLRGRLRPELEPDHRRP